MKSENFQTLSKIVFDQQSAARGPRPPEPPLLRHCIGPFISTRLLLAWSERYSTV